MGGGTRLFPRRIAFANITARKIRGKMSNGLFPNPKEREGYACFFYMLTLSVFVIFDLNLPDRGTIQEPFEHFLRSMEKQSGTK
jgi:hypothetical protein